MNDRKRPYDLASPPRQADDVTRDPEQEARFDRVRELARADVANDRDPRVLTYELAAFQTEYDDAYTQAQLEFVDRSN